MDTAGVGSMKILVVIIRVVSDIIGGSVFAKGTDGFTGCGRVTVRIR
jgi:hypothetical protein